MEGLRLAAVGDAMVEFNIGECGDGSTSRFREGGRIAVDSTMTPGGGTVVRPRHQNLSMTPGLLPPSHTILNIGSTPTRNAAELRALLGNSNARLKPRAVMLPSPGERPVKKIKAVDAVSLEQAKQRARVEVDVVLESDMCVQGGFVRGHIKVHVRKRSKKESPVLLAEGKLRIVGFETIPNEGDYHTFYQCASPFSVITDASQSLYVSSPDLEGYAQAVEGVHVLPFAMELPVNSPFGCAKGVVNMRSGLTVRYVAMVSIKVKDAESGRRSIAHFYRNCEVWPLLDPKVILAAAPRPLQASTAKSLSMLGGGGSNDKVKLTANLHRLHWVAGQRCYVRVLVNNGSKKTVKSLTLCLIRTTTIFKPRPGLDAGHESSADPDACQTSTTHKLITETVLEMAQRSARGHASAKGWWTGVRPGQDLEFAHFILLPPNALSITRGRLLEVEYSIRVTLSAGSLTSDIFVTLPIRIINFMSIDPIPSAGLLSPNGAYSRTVKHLSPHQLSANQPYKSMSADPTSKHVRHPASDDRKLPASSSHGRSKVVDTQSSALASSASSASSALFAPPQLQITNPDPRSDSSDSEGTPIAHRIQQALSEVSVYSTDTSLGSGLSSTSASASSFNSYASQDRRLGNMYCPSGMDDVDSDAELAYVMGSVKLEQREGWNDSEFDVRDEGGSANGNESFENIESDEGYSSINTSDLSGYSDASQDGSRGMEGKTHEAMGSQPEPYLDMNEETPRAGYTAPVTRRRRNHDLPVVTGTQQQQQKSNHRRIPSCVRGPRDSRVLPRPPMSDLERKSTGSLPSNTSLSSSGSYSQELPRPPSMDVHSQNRPVEGMQQAGESSISVKHKVAALEHRVNTARGSGDAYV
ncbi:unnamed protein product [Somion occarium]|uniref:Arrestin C-terminal-like domain-containing protein n=1 Tax=Somion occarium TaxID=3059160 RepID=A0ABP1CHP1_9APHY